MSLSLNPETHAPSAAPAAEPANTGLRVHRRFTVPDVHPFDTVKWDRRRTVITNPDGSVVFQADDVEVPADWSQLATDIVVSKYFRRAGVPGAPGRETSVRQVVNRLVRTIRAAGEQQGGYFASREDADAFESELAYMLVHQIGAFNSPVWFNCGLFHEYGIVGSGGSFAVDLATDTVQMTSDGYSRPQVSACFIQSCNDDLMSIFELVKNEARVFKYGSGCTSGDSRVYVEGEGFVQIRELFQRFRDAGRAPRDFDGKGRYIDVSDQGLRTLSVDPTTGEYVLDRIDRVWSYDVAADDKVTVRFDTGAKAVVSAWHPFLVWDGTAVVERRADALRRGDTVLGPNESALASLPVRPAEVVYDTRYFGAFETHRVRIDQDLAWLCGYFMGDGSLGSCRRRTTNNRGTTYQYDGLRVRFHDETVEALQRVQSIVEMAFGETASIQADGRGSKGRHLTYTGRRVTGFFAALFNVGPKTHTLSMPAFIWESGRDLVLAFLAGLLDSDGHVADGRAQYSSSSRVFASEVATLANLHGLGGGLTHDRSVATSTVVHRSVGADQRAALAAHMANPRRRGRLLEYSPTHERKYCLPLGRDLQAELFGEGHAPADWLKLPVGGESLHLGRLQYEGLINPRKLEKGVALLERTDALGELLARVARSAAFVTSVEPCRDDPDFYDLTVARNNNYLAGEHGLVAIHNTGTNFSKLRGRMEKLSGGGTSSGLMSFLEVLDRGAGATKSGGTTRRAAKMVVLDVDHPEIVDFVRWKMREERKVAALIAAGYSSDFNGEAYATVSGQNSNNSVRVPDKFMHAVETDGAWETTFRTTGQVHESMPARQLWDEIAQAAWSCADPGVQFDDTIQKWHTCKATDRIFATNPCSEFIFLDDTACNLASINLMKFRGEDGSFDIEGYRHANRVFFLAQEILVSFASYPTERIARNSEDYRPLGLGYANLGTLLMVEGLPYDSDAARAYAGTITAMMTGEAYALSAEMAASKGPFRGYAGNADSMMSVMRLHREAARAIDPAHAPRDMRQAAIECWDRAVAYGGLHGYRNAQATVLAPTGTIGLLMDCDTTGVEPDFALVKFKKLAGGGYFKIVNQSVPLALRRLGYDDKEIDRIIRYAVGYGSLNGAPHVNPSSLLNKGFSDAQVAAIEAVLPNVLDIRQAFGRGIVADETLTRLGVAMAEREKPGFNVLPFLGFTDHQIEEANLHVCGAQTVEGAPGLKPEHLAVFDCANRCGTHGTRFIQPMGHVRMMSAVQPFISGAISKTVNLPHDATVDEVRDIYTESWKLGIKAVALYRDGCKMSQPLSTTKKKADAVAADKPAPDEGPPKLHRRRLPKRRHGFTQEARIAGHKVFLRTGEYEDGTIGEIFIDMHKEGAAFRSMMNCFAISVSMGLQYGVPLEDLVDQFCFTRFEPHGRVEGHDNIKVSTSVIDYVFRVLGFEYLNRTDLAHVIDTAPSGEVLQPRLHATDVPVGREHRVARPAAAAPEARAPRAGRSAENAGDITGAVMQEATKKFKGDAPACDNCGHITVRNGTCYKCLNCGNSQGCS